MRAAILVSAPFDRGVQEKINAGLHPRRDFLTLAEALDADLIFPLKSSRSAVPQLSKPIGFFRSAWAAFQQRHKYDVIISDLDRVGLLLALMLKFANSRLCHIVICHGKIIQPYDLRLIQTFQLQEHINRFVCYGPQVAARLREALALPEHQVVTVRHPADHGFWRPQPVAPKKLVISAGMMSRDYPTLVEAMRGQEVSLQIAAYSPWVVGKKNGLRREALPANVHVSRSGYLELRDLYARALCVAVPLYNTDIPAGSLVTYEAMAMGKPVLVTRTQGHDALGVITDGETGYYIDPGDVQGWRDKIRYLYEHPEEARKMGQRARAVVEAGINLDTYILQMVSLVRAAADESRVT